MALQFPDRGMSFCLRRPRDDAHADATAPKGRPIPNGRQMIPPMLSMSDLKHTEILLITMSAYSIPVASLRVSTAVSAAYGSILRGAEFQVCDTIEKFSDLRTILSRSGLPNQTTTGSAVRNLPLTTAAALGRTVQTASGATSIIPRRPAGVNVRLGNVFGQPLRRRKTGPF